MSIATEVLTLVAKQKSLNEVKMDGLDGADRLDLYNYYADDAKKRKDDKELLGIYRSAAPLLQSKDHPIAKKIRDYIRDVYEDIDYEMRKKYSHIAHIERFDGEPVEYHVKGLLEEQHKFENAINGLCNIYTVNDLSVSNTSERDNIFEGVFVTSLMNKSPYSGFRIYEKDMGTASDYSGCDVKAFNKDGGLTTFYSSSTNYNKINFIGTGLNNGKTIESHVPFGTYEGIIGLSMIRGVIATGNVDGSVAPFAKGGIISVGRVEGEVGFHSSADVNVNGRVDGHVGRYYDGGSIEVKGEVYGSVGREMKQGILKIREHRSNNGGRVGERMEGGTIIIGSTNRSVGVRATGGEIYYEKIPFNSWLLSRCPATINDFSVWDVRKLIEANELSKKADYENYASLRTFRKLRSARRWGDKNLSNAQKDHKPFYKRKLYHNIGMLRFATIHPWRAFKHAAAERKFRKSDLEEVAMKELSERAYQIVEAKRFLGL